MVKLVLDVDFDFSAGLEEGDEKLLAAAVEGETDFFSTFGNPCTAIGDGYGILVAMLSLDRKRVEVKRLGSNAVVVGLDTDSATQSIQLFLHEGTVHLNTTVLSLGRKARIFDLELPVRAATGEAQGSAGGGGVTEEQMRQLAKMVATELLLGPPASEHLGLAPHLHMGTFLQEVMVYALLTPGVIREAILRADTEANALLASGYKSKLLP